MKLFGGSGEHNGRSDRQTKKRPAAAQSGVKAQTAPKPQGKKGGRTAAPKKHSKKRIAAIVIAVLIALLCACGAAYYVFFVRPPTDTIHDRTNGDRVDTSSLLNQGTRIDDVFTFVVGAVDEDQTRTDALMVATMNTKEKTINVMNIPRDTMCNNGESGAWRKINAAYATKKGIEQTKVEIERLMGFQPDKYVIVNFEGIAAIVDAIGGVDYEVPFRMEYHDPSQHLDIDLQPGMQHLTGKQTVEFLRWRHNNDYSKQYVNGDEGRVENQQKFLRELARQVLQVKNATKIPKIAEAVSKNVKTDFTTGELLWMGKQALQIDNANLKFFTLPGYGAMSYAGSDPYKYSFFFPKEKETLELINKYFNPCEEPITKLDMSPVRRRARPPVTAAASAPARMRMSGATPAAATIMRTIRTIRAARAAETTRAAARAATKSRITAAEITRTAQPAAVRPAAKAAVNPAARAADRSRAARPAAVNLAARAAETIRAARPAVRPAAKAAAR